LESKFYVRELETLEVITVKRNQQRNWNSRQSASKKFNDSRLSFWPQLGLTSGAMGRHLDLFCRDKAVRNWHAFGLIVAEIARGVLSIQDLVNSNQQGQL